MNENILIAASPGSASRSFLKSIENSIKKKSLNLKSSTHIGNLIININLKQKIYFYLNNKLFINKKFLFFQHFFPTYYLFLLNKYIGQTVLLLHIETYLNKLNIFINQLIMG